MVVIYASSIPQSDDSSIHKMLVDSMDFYQFENFGAKNGQNFGQNTVFIYGHKSNKTVQISEIFVFLACRHVGREYSLIGLSQVQMEI